MKGEVKLIFFGLPCHVFGKRHSLPANVMNTEYSVFISVFKKEKSSGCVRRHSLPEVSFLFWVHDNSGKYKNIQDSSSLFYQPYFANHSIAVCANPTYIQIDGLGHILLEVYIDKKKCTSHSAFWIYLLGIQ